MSGDVTATIEAARHALGSDLSVTIIAVSDLSTLLAEVERLHAEPDLEGMAAALMEASHEPPLDDGERGMVEARAMARVLLTTYGVRSPATEVLRGFEETRAQLVDSLSHVDESTDPVLLATRVVAALQGNPAWESVEVDQ